MMDLEARVQTLPDALFRSEEIKPPEVCIRVCV